MASTQGHGAKAAQLPILVRDRSRVAPVEQAVSAMTPANVMKLAGASLAGLSSKTAVEHIEVAVPAITDLGDRRFATSATVFVKLRYGRVGDDLVVSESLPATVEGHFTGDGKAKIDRLHVDSSALTE